MTLAEVRVMAVDLMQQHKLLQAGWRFRFNKCATLIGRCRYRVMLIEYSVHFATNATYDQVRDTILHEIAHALCPKAGHGPEWKAMAIRIGARPQRCKSVESTKTPKYTARCAVHGVVGHRHRIPKGRRSCGVCAPHRFSVDHLLSYSRVASRSSEGFRWVTTR